MEEVVIYITEIVEEVTINITGPAVEEASIVISEAIQGERGIPGEASTVAGPKGDKGDKGDSFVYTDFTPQQLEDLKGDPFTYTDFTPEQIEALKVKGDQGDAFEYSDFTPEQIAALKGEKGDAFVYEDFTPEEIALLKGDKGEDSTVPGPKGDKGDTPIKGVDYFDGEDGQDSTVPGPPGSDATVTKVAVEAVLTGDISTHSHSAYLTREQIEGMI
jgi:hypothetical protein